MSKPPYQIAAFYEFKNIAENAALEELREAVRAAVIESGVRGTVILADEGYNGMVCGTASEIDAFLTRLAGILKTEIDPKISYYDERPFRRVDVKIKREIVTLKQPVDLSLGKGTHVSPAQWNELISDPETLVLDARNDYEYRTGTFQGALNPRTSKFSDLPRFVADHLDPSVHTRVAMFCTGGIRCEKFAPYLRQLGFAEVYQLEGGILRYLEKVPAEQSMWQGECFVFDERVSVGHNLEKGSQPDHSQRRKKDRQR